MLSSQSLLNGVRMEQLTDADASTWSDSVLVMALNQALDMLVLARPDATAKNMVMGVVSGARQSIPSDGVRLLRVVCNIRSDGTAGGIIRLVQKEDMDSISHSWLYATGLHVKEYMFDSRIPKQFFIYPTVISDSKIEIEYSARLARIEVASDEYDIAADAIYAQPIQEFMLHKLLPSSAGINHLRNALDLLGVKEAQDERVSAARKGSN